MTPRYPIDPDDPERSQKTASEIADQLAPIAPSADRRLALRDRLMQRVRSARASAHNVTFVRPKQSEFRSLMTGVRVMSLSAANRAVLLEFSAGASLPMHRHHEDEECVVLRGRAQIQDIEVGAGDYHLAQADTRHATVRSATGAVLFVRGTPIGSMTGVLRDLVTAWLPAPAPTHVTLRADEGRWDEVVPGVMGRLLNERDQCRSWMIRVEPGAHFEPTRLGRPLESIVVQGHAYFGDEPVGPGDYETYSAPDGAPEIGSDAGAMVFLRSGAARPRAQNDGGH